jgi:hypothetical protein
VQIRERRETTLAEECTYPERIVLTVDPGLGDLSEGDALIEDRKIAVTVPEIKATNEWAVPSVVPNPAHTRRG